MQVHAITDNWCDFRPDELIAEIRQIALRAGAVILDIYGREFRVSEKADASPVTEADEAAERVIVAALRAMTPEIPVIAEEEIAAGRTETMTEDRFWLVDPLDGTKEFIARNGEFTVNIALIERGLPVLGVVHAPALGSTYTGAGPGTAVAETGGGTPQPISVRHIPPDGAVVVSSRSHGNQEQLRQLTKRIKVAGSRSAGSSLKFCLVACGEADLYPRFGRTCEWDTAAGHAVFAAAGGSVCTVDGPDLKYGKPEFYNPHFIARGLD